jgi:hypothetical protein
MATDFRSKRLSRRNRCVAVVQSVRQKELTQQFKLNYLKSPQYAHTNTLCPHS